VLGVVGVEALVYEFTPAEWPVVGVLAGCGPAEDAGRVLGEDAGAEALLVLSSVSSLPCAAAPLLGFGRAAVALAAAL
jgi:hypothetical protein